jgi:thimet oligopeptidase
MDTLHLWNGPTTAEAAKQWTDHHLAASREKIATLLALDSPHTVSNTLTLFDQAQWHLRMAGSQTGVMFMVHPASEVRDAVQDLSQTVSAEGVALSLNQEVYKALASIDATHEDAATRYYLERTLLGYRLSGVDRDEPTRNKVRALAERMTELSMTFARTVQDDVRQIPVDNPNDLLGLPADYLTRHGITTAPEGTLTATEPITLTTDPPEMSPIMSYAISPALRRRMYLAYNDRGYPANKQVLLDLLSLRQEMAELLGFRSWADLATVDQMMGSAANMRTFLNKVEEAARETAHHEYTELESFVRSHDPQALPLTLSDARFWEEQFRRARYDFDSQSVRPYFPYTPVEAGILATAGKLFQVRFVLAPNAPVWDPAVKAFDIYEEPEPTEAAERTLDPSSPLGFPSRSPLGFPFRSAAEESAVAPAHTPVQPQPSTTLETPIPYSLLPTPSPVGRIYLDMHPREGKSKWFSECSLVGGVLNSQIPEASLVCNFPQPTANDPGLMQFSDVVTYFHEFGHLMHEVLGGRQRWSGQSGIATEGDFVEVPSQMLEEFFEDPELLRTFARHYETGEPIPYETVARMTRASAHGRALSTLTQVMYATYSMETHDRTAAELDLDTLLREGYDRFSLYEFVDGNRMYAAFTHLVGYTSNYYTYLYDKVMALEFFEEFKKTTPFDTTTAMRYRRQVLEPGGSKPARQLVHDFLGREVSMTALQTWIQKSTT